MEPIKYVIPPRITDKIRVNYLKNWIPEHGEITVKPNLPIRLLNGYILGTRGAFSIDQQEVNDNYYKLWHLLNTNNLQRNDDGSWSPMNLKYE